MLGLVCFLTATEMQINVVPFSFQMPFSYDVGFFTSADKQWRSSSRRQVTETVFPRTGNDAAG